MDNRSTVVSRGVVAGLAAGAAMALWFLLVDGSQGQPFRTPAFLASALLGHDEVVRAAGPVALYTLVHFGLFAALGVGVCWAVSKLPSAPNVLLGLALGFLLFDGVFYLSVVITGVDIVAALGWPAVLVGNLVAGVALMGVLHMFGGAGREPWWTPLSESRVVREGVAAGLVGAGTVALWFLVIDFAQGRPFFTPGALGSALFLGSTDLDSVTINLLTVGGYTVLHVLAFAVVGMIATAIACGAERTPPMLIGGIMLFISFEALFMGVMALVAEFLLGAMAWWTIAAGNILATVGMGWYLLGRHPKLQEMLRRTHLAEV
ncbi:MAG: hypothetical protein D6701_07415 [Gemmatimonadetes bacterium]|nr:MAG: hypothetical protein D6701_07415 [Gemmatimonadota bacterium]